MQPAGAVRSGYWRDWFGPLPVAEEIHLSRGPFDRRRIVPMKQAVNRMERGARNADHLARRHPIEEQPGLHGVDHRPEESCGRRLRRMVECVQRAEMGDRVRSAIRDHSACVGHARPTTCVYAAFQHVAKSIVGAAKRAANPVGVASRFCKTAVEDGSHRDTHDNRPPYATVPQSTAWPNWRRSI